HRATWLGLVILLGLCPSAALGDDAKPADKAPVAKPAASAASDAATAPSRAEGPVVLADRLRGPVGVGGILGLAHALSPDRRAVSRRVLFWGLVLQWAFALVVLRVPAGERVLRMAGVVVEEVLGCALVGAEFVFGKKLVDPSGPVEFVFAFRVL